MRLRNGRRRHEEVEKKERSEDIKPKAGGLSKAAAERGGCEYGAKRGLVLYLVPYFVPAALIIVSKS